MDEAIKAAVEAVSAEIDRCAIHNYGGAPAAEDVTRIAISAYLQASGMRVLPAEPIEEMIDAPRGLIMYFNGMGSRKWTLGQHVDAAGYDPKGLLSDEDRASYHFPKADQAVLIWRFMAASAPEVKL